LSAFINSIAKAVSAFKSRNYFDAIQHLSEAFETVETAYFVKIDNEIFNTIFDAVEIAELIAELPVFEKNDFSESAFINIKEALQAFTKSEGSTSAALLKSLDDFILLLEGMNLGMKYLHKKKFRPDDFPPQVSFEILADAQIKLYTWNEEKDGLVVGIALLKNEFEKLFEKENKSKAHYLETADTLFSNNAYHECLHLLEQAAAEHESLKCECYLRMGNVFLKLEKPADAVDFYMKARVLGATKVQLSSGIKTACYTMLKNPKHEDQWDILNDLIEEFSI
jgi:hypothetical protein